MTITAPQKTTQQELPDGLWSGRVKSFAKLETLRAKLEAAGLAGWKPLIVRDADGRWTAIFSRARIEALEPHAMAMQVVWAGFMLCD